MTAQPEIRPEAVRPTGPVGLLERLRARPLRFEFFQAVWLLERYGTGSVRVGQRGPVSQEGLRFRADASLAFPATDLRRLIPVRDEGTGACYDLLEIACLGLYGVSTPLPLHYAVAICRHADNPPAPGAWQTAGAESTGVAADPARALLDVVNHRLISLLYRAWLKYRYERSFSAAERDAITVYLRNLIGCPLPLDQAELGVPPVRLLRYAGVLPQHPRSAAVLAGVLCDWWGGLPVEVAQWTGAWHALDAADFNALGERNCRPGEDLTVGDQVYDLAATFTIQVGPVDWVTFMTFVPGSARYDDAVALTRLLCADPLAFELEVTLAPDQVPELCLQAGDTAARLGYTSWVRTAALGQTRVVFQVPDVPATAGVHPVGANAAVPRTARTTQECADE